MPRPLRFGPVLPLVPSSSWHESQSLVAEQRLALLGELGVDVRRAALAVHELGQGLHLLWCPFDGPSCPFQSSRGPMYSLPLGSAQEAGDPGARVVVREIRALVAADARSASGTRRSAPPRSRARDKRDRSGTPRRRPAPARPAAPGAAPSRPSPAPRARCLRTFGSCASCRVAQQPEHDHERAAPIAAAEQERPALPGSRVGERSMNGKPTSSAPAMPGSTIVPTTSSDPSKYFSSWNSGRKYHSGRAG